jgi:hypothetical protein
MTITQTLFLPFLAEYTLHPYNQTEAALMSCPEWQKGLYFGRPRSGHPEGMVLYHLQEVLYNISLIDAFIDEHTHDRLRFIALVHDNFKYAALYRSGQKIPPQYHHAYLARQFASRFTQDQQLLNVIEWHDHVFHIWRKGKQSGNWQEAERELYALAQSLGDALQLFYLFFKCDTRTGDKTQQPLHWFEACLRHQIYFVPLKEYWNI